jgi:hypothetical protein
LSSILKALKKLEEEYPNPTDAVSWPRKLGPTRIIRRWEIHSRRLTRVLWGFMGLLVLTAGGWVVFYMQRPIAAEPNSVADVTIPEPVILRKSPVREIKRRPRPTPGRGASSRTGARADGAAHRMREAAAQPPAETAKTPMTPATQFSGRLQPSAPNPKGTERVRPLPPGLTLQAISWSEQQGERMAVINNEIVREGTTLEGYDVVRIESDSVLLRKDGESWTLAFSLQKSSD